MKKQKNKNKKDIMPANPGDSEQLKPKIIVHRERYIPNKGPSHDEIMEMLLSVYDKYQDKFEDIVDKV